MIEVPVFVSEWQQCCCGRAFALGGQVEWTLELGDAADAWLPDGLAVSLTVDVGSHSAPWQERFPTVIRRGELVAYWRAPIRVERDARVRGIFFEEHHGGVPDDLAATRGTVRRIRALWAPKQTRDEGRTRIYEPTHGMLDLREVASSEDDEGGGRERPAPNYTFDGWLIDLAVEDE